MPDPVPFRSSRHTRAIVVADWRDAEELARWHMREVLGFRDAELTPPGADGGIDVVSAHALAQVKHYAAPVGSPEVQQHAGAAHRAKLALFYALTGYTAAALEYANTAGLSLFTYDIYGDVHAANGPARQLQASGTDTGPQTPRDAATEQLRRDAAAATEVFDRELAAAARFSEQFAFSRTLDADEVEDIERFIVIELVAVVALLEELRVKRPHDEQVPALRNEILASVGHERTWQEWIYALAVWRHRTHEPFARLYASEQRGRDETVSDRARVLLADAYRRGHWAKEKDRNTTPIRLADRWKSRPLGNRYRESTREDDWMRWAASERRWKAIEAPSWWQPFTKEHIFGLPHEENARLYDYKHSGYRDGGPWTLV
ncbi:restriction endonuclease [Promicromonospora sp. Marseille-Q5078]